MQPLTIVVPLAAAFIAGSVLCAQQPNRINREVSSTRLTTLANHHPQWASAGNSSGLVPLNQAFDAMTVVLSRSPEQEQAFEKLLADQQNPVSPEYHHWLTPAEAGMRFGLSDQDMLAITGWLQLQGLHVNWISPSRIFIGFGGSAADIGRAFHTEMHTYNVDGVERMSVSSDPMIPEALAPVIKAIQGLYSIDNRAAHHISGVQLASPELTLSNGNNYITPADFQTIYDGVVSYSGYGETIGIVGLSRTDFADFFNFRQKTLGNLQTPTEIVPTAFGGVDPGPALTAPPAPGVSAGAQGEATLDVLRAGSVAPNANLLLVIATGQSGGIEADAQYLVQSSPVPAQVMTISFGQCESAVGPAAVSFWDTLFQQAAAEGISVFVSSGDSGASGCDPNFASPPASPAPNSPNYICSSSYATCVGGTEFNDLSTPSLYWNTSNGTNLASARMYIPEGGWNDPLNGTKTIVASSGGGVSTIIPTPSWQTGTGVPTARTGRYTPDVSFSGACHDSYFACFAAGGGGCASDSTGRYYFLGFCGTSASAPSMAGVAALLDEKQGSAQGNLNPGIYATAASSAGAFHDVTVATSGVAACDVNTPSMCNNSIPGPTGLSGGQAGFLVTPGYDLVTGLGSLDVLKFLNDFANPVIAPTVTVTLSASSITAVQPLTVTVAVSGGGSSPIPTGSVVLTIGSYIHAAITLVNGGATFNIPGGTLSAGADSGIVKVTYTPDDASAVTYRVSSGSSNLSVVFIFPTVTVTPSASSITTAEALKVTVIVDGGSGNPAPSGTINISGGGFYLGPLPLTNGAVTVNLPAGALAPGVDNLAAYYQPDAQGYSTYNTAFNSVTVTVTAAAGLTPTITVTPSSATAARAEPLPVTVSVSGGSGDPTPSGSVMLVSGIYSSPSANLNGGTATITIPAGSLAVGYDTLTAIYSPDAASAPTYNNASGSSPVSVLDPVKSTPVVTVGAAQSSITTAQDLSVSVAVSGSNGWATATGSITLSGGGYTPGAAILSNNSVTFTIPAGSLAVGVDTLTATYTPDAASSAIFFSATGSTSVTVTTPAPPSFTIAGSPPTFIAGATTFNTSTITIAPTGGFTGTVALTAAVTLSPPNAQHPPTLSFGLTSPVSITGANAVTATLTISTTAPTTSALAFPVDRGIPWYQAGGVTLACLLLFGIPAKRRNWRTVIGMLVLLTSLCGGILACGGGGSTGGGGGTTIPGTTPGTYTVTVTGTSGTTTATGTLNLVVE